MLSPFPQYFFKPHGPLKTLKFFPFAVSGGKTLQRAAVFTSSSSRGCRMASANGTAKRESLHRCDVFRFSKDFFGPSCLLKFFLCTICFANVFLSRRHPATSFLQCTGTQNQPAKSESFIGSLHMVKTVQVYL